MDEILKTALLAVIQGITEFLPISSSGHLVILGDILEIKEDSITVLSVLHAGTLLSILLVYFREIISALRSERRTLFLIFASSVPAGVAGLAIHAYGLDNILFGSPVLAGAGLFVTAGVLYYLPGRQAQSKDISGMSFTDALLIGLAQCVAILPGISRSGTTISAALRLKLKRSEASTYSFLMAVPVIAGATFIEVLPILRNSDARPEASGLIALTAGFVISAVVGYAALNTVIVSVRKGSLLGYGRYCLALGSATLLYHGIRSVI